MVSVRAVWKFALPGSPLFLSTNDNTPHSEDRQGKANLFLHLIYFIDIHYYHATMLNSGAVDFEIIDLLYPILELSLVNTP